MAGQIHTESCEDRVQPECEKECEGRKGRDFEECTWNCIWNKCGYFDEPFDFVEEDLEPELEDYDEYEDYEFEEEL